MFRVLFVLPLFACTVQPINQTEKTEEENPYPDGFQFGDLVIDPGFIDFGNVELDATKTEDLVFINTGSSTVSVVSASIDGDSAFTLESSFLNFDLEPEAEEIVSVRFTPVQETSYEASLSVLISTESSAGEVELSGLGGDAQGSEPSGEPSEEPQEGGLELDKTSHNFGVISLNSTATLVINVDNPTEENITITGVSSTDAAFEISPYSNVQVDESISAGITRTLTINFTPTEEITYEGTITLETDSPDSPEIEIDLSGEGVYQCTVCSPQLRVEGQMSPVKAEVFQVGEMEAFGFPLWSEPNPNTQTLIIENTGDEELVITDIQIANDQGQPDYNQDFGNNCGTDGEFTLIGTNLPITIPPFDVQSQTASSATITVQYEYTGTAGGNCNDCYFTELLKDLLGLPFGGVSDDSLGAFGVSNFTKMTIVSNDNSGPFSVFLGAEVGTVQ